MAARFKSELLVRVRVELGLTQEEAARAAGVDVRTYRRYETGEVNETGDFEVRRASRRKILERIERELGIPAHDLVEEEDAPARATTEPSSAALPRARHFVGRHELLARLDAWLRDEGAKARVVAIVAIGGAGKTSLLERALDRWSPPVPPLARDRAMVHSFYEEPSVDAFLARSTGTQASLFVLDGLELVQASGDDGRARGEIEDRRLVRFFRALVRDRGARVIVTSRFPLVDLAAFEGDGLMSIALPPLDVAETSELLQRWGVRGTPAAFGDVHTQTGGHALAIAVTGSYAAEFLGADLDAALKLDLEDAARDEPLARRLHRLLANYAAELSQLDRDVLAYACIFPRGIDEGRLSRIPKLANERLVDLRASLGRLVHRGLAVKVGENLSAHPFIREHFRSLVVDAPAIHGQERDRIRARVLAGLEDAPLHRPDDRALLDACEALFEHTLLAGDALDAFDLMAQLLGGFEHLGLRLGDFERGLRMTRAFDEVIERLPDDVRWRLRYDRGLYCAALGDLESAERAYRANIANNDTNSTAHRTLAYTLRLRGDFARAHEHALRSIDLGQRARMVGEQVRGIALRGAIFTSEGKLSDAKEAFAQARALGDQPNARRAIWEAEYLQAIGDNDQAAQLTRTNLAFCEKRGWAGHVAHCHVVLGRAALAAGKHDDTTLALATASEWCDRSREVELYLWTHLLELDLARALADVTQASITRERIRDAAVAGGYGLFLRELDSRV